MEVNRCFGCMETTKAYPCPHCGYDPQQDKAQVHVLPPGTILYGKYLIGKVLGQGGFGITYLGFDLALERKVAIKEYFPSGQVSRHCGSSLELVWYTTEMAREARENGMQMFLREARKMTKVSDIPNVVHVLDLFQENNTAYIIMEYVQGETLKARLQRTGPVDWPTAQRLFTPVIQAMERVHQAGLIHRDLSPDNLMIQRGGEVKILDLGAAKDLNRNSGTSSVVVAKGGFSPLEQYAQRGSAGPWSDVYALCATLYWALTGVVPPSAIDRVNRDTLRWDLPQLLQLPQPVLRTMEKAMRLRPEERTASMAEFGSQLQLSKPAGRKKLPWILPVCLAAVLAAAVLGLWANRDTAAEPTEIRTYTTVSTVPPLRETVPVSLASEPLFTEASTIPTLSRAYVAIACGQKHTVILYNDGTVKAVGDNRKGQCEVSGWTDIVQISAAGDFTVGLRADGTVVAAGDNTCGQCNVSAWRDITQISTGKEHTVGLRSDGTVVAVGDDDEGKRKVEQWRGITAISAGDTHTVGLRADGTVVATGKNEDKRIDVESWRNVESIYTGAWSTIGLTESGTVLYCGNGGGPSWEDAQQWTHIVMIAAGNMFTVGLDENGRVHFGGVNDVGQSQAKNWTDIVYIAAGPQHILGIQADGTCLCAGRNDYGQGSLTREDLFAS